MNIFCPIIIGSFGTCPNECKNEKQTNMNIIIVRVIFDIIAANG